MFYLNNNQKCVAYNKDFTCSEHLGWQKVGDLGQKLKEANTKVQTEKIGPLASLQHYPDPNPSAFHKRSEVFLYIYKMNILKQQRWSGLFLQTTFSALRS